MGPKDQRGVRKEEKEEGTTHRCVDALGGPTQLTWGAVFIVNVVPGATLGEKSRALTIYKFKTPGLVFVACSGRSAPFTPCDGRR